MIRRQLLWGLAGTGVFGLVGTAWSALPGRWRAPSGDWLETLPRGQFPASLKDASPKAREMYRLAVACTAPVFGAVTRPFSRGTLDRDTTEE